MLKNNNNISNLILLKTDEIPSLQSYSD